jgi:histidinol-phosphate aminotransferase
MLPSIHSLRPVERGVADPSVHRLQWNESPFPFPADLKEEVLQRLLAAEWERYPRSLRPFGLIDALAAHLGVDADRLIVSGGSSDVIRVVLSALLQPGDVVVEPSPTFLLYRRQAALLGATLVGVPCDEGADWALPVDALLSTAAERQAKAIVLCAPNNPTGTVHARASLERLVEGADALGAFVVIDEAYLYFNPHDLLPLALAHENVVLVRTLSKAYSMAGVRVGYAVAAPDLAADLQKIVTSFPLSLFSEIVGEVAIEQHDRFMAQVAQVVAEREKLARSLAALPGLRVSSSGANFLLVRPDLPARPILDHLRTAHRVLISDCAGYPELSNHLRISIGTPEQNALVVQGFTEHLASR